MANIKQILGYWEVPEGLDEKGREAAIIIRDFCLANNKANAGQKVFHDPKYYRGGASLLGEDSLLIVLHEEGDHDAVTNMDGAYAAGLNSGQDKYHLYDQLVKKLDEAGLYLEQQTRWYSGVYAKTDPNATVEITVKLKVEVPRRLLGIVDGKHADGPIASQELQDYLNDKLNNDPDFFGEIDAGCIDIPQL